MVKRTRKGKEKKKLTKEKRKNHYRNVCNIFLKKTTTNNLERRFIRVIKAN